MGHLINPISFRLGLTTFWRSNYVHSFLKGREFFYFFYFDKIIIEFFNWVLRLNWYVAPFLKEFRRKQKRRGERKRKGLVLIFSNIPNLSLFKEEYIISIGFLCLNCLVSSFCIYLSLSDSRWIFYFNFRARRNKKKKVKKSRWLLKRSIITTISHFVVYHGGFYRKKIMLFITNKEYEKVFLRGHINRDFIELIQKFCSEFKAYERVLLKIYLPIYLRVILLRFLGLCFFFNFFANWDIMARVCKIYFAIGFFDVFRKKWLYHFLKRRGFGVFLFFSFYFYLKRFFYRQNKIYWNFRNFFKVRTFFLGKFMNLLVGYFFKVKFFYMFQTFLNVYFFPAKIDLFVRFLMEQQNITSRLLYYYFVRNLKSRKPIGKIVDLIVSDIEIVQGFLGFKILTSGRFTRKERAFYKWVSVKRVPLSMYNSVVDYFSGTYKSRFGICSLRVWLFKRLN